MSTASTPDRRRQACPLCGKPAVQGHAPFCGQGCRDRDLLNWLGDAYRVRGPAAADAAFERGEDGLDSDRAPPL